MKVERVENELHVFLIPLTYEQRHYKRWRKNHKGDQSSLKSSVKMQHPHKQNLTDRDGKSKCNHRSDACEAVKSNTFSHHQVCGSGIARCQNELKQGLPNNKGVVRRKCYEFLRGGQGDKRIKAIDSDWKIISALQRFF